MGVSVYGPQKIDFKKITESDKFSLKDMLTQAMMNMALSDESKLGPVGTGDIWGSIVTTFQCPSIGYGYYAAKNNSKKKVKTTLKFQNDELMPVSMSFFSYFFSHTWVHWRSENL